MAIEVCPESNAATVETYLNSHLAASDEFTNRAVNWLQQATSSAKVANYNISYPSTKSAGASVTGNFLTDLSAMPSLNVNQIDGVTIGDPDELDIIPDIEENVTFPTFNETKPTQLIRNAPTVDNESKIDYATLDQDIDITSVEIPVFEDPPILREIEDITLTEIDIPDFTPIAVNTAIDALDEGKFDYTEPAYASYIADQLSVRFAQISTNDYGIPDIVWDMIWQKGRDREQFAVDQVLDEIDVDIAARGFFLPQGIQLARKDKARQEALQKTIDYNREQVIAQEQEKIKRLEFHVTQGIAYEQLLMNNFNAIQGRTLDAAKYTFNAHLEVFNAQVSYINMHIAYYNAQAQVFKIQVDAELAKLEADKIRLEQLKLKSELNKDDISIFISKIDAINSKIAAYKTKADVEVMKLEEDKMKMQKYQTDITNYRERLQGNLTEFNIWKSEIEAKGLEYDNYKTAVQAFVAEVDAYKADIEAQSTKIGAVASRNKNLIEQFDAEVRAANAQLDAQVAELDANIKAGTFNLDKIKVKNDAESQKAQIALESFKNNLADTEQRLRVSIENAKIKTEVSTANANLSMSRSNAVGELYSSLAAASLSAASISYGFSSSNSCNSSTSVSTSL